MRFEDETSNCKGSRRFVETTAAKYSIEKSNHISLRELCEMVHPKRFELLTPRFVVCDFIDFSVSCFIL
jgi:hypothetical protein